MVASGPPLYSGLAFNLRLESVTKFDNMEQLQTGVYANQNMLINHVLIQAILATSPTQLISNSRCTGHQLSCPHVSPHPAPPFSMSRFALLITHWSPTCLQDRFVLIMAKDYLRPPVLHTSVTNTVVSRM